MKVDIKKIIGGVLFMASYKTTINEKHGNLTITGHAKIDTHNYCLCKCKCGKIAKVREKSLRSGHTKSCGCLRLKHLKKRFADNLIGLTFGKLKVINRNYDKNDTAWNCLCECGKEVVVLSYNLKNHNTKSCGCYHKSKVTKHGLSRNGRQYIKYLYAHNPAYWLHRRVSSAITLNLKKCCLTKLGSILDYLPFTMDQLKLHLESLWEPWMNWSNYGGKNNDSRKTWQIDHIIPKSKFNITKLGDSEFIECWSLSNLRPLEKNENFKKGNRLK